jgi:outer membrane protein OmpA-like peptidoglycan-associated protein
MTSRSGTKTAAVSLLAFFALLAGCADPKAGPDKTLAGAILGAGWGAGAGAVVGNQVEASGEGIAVGAGLGAAAGLMMGAGWDIEENQHITMSQQLASLKVQSQANGIELEKIQARLDNTSGVDPIGGVYQVFFDEDQTNLRIGGMEGLEQVADAIKTNSMVTAVHVAGHTDDTGNPEYNEKLAQARASTVGAYLASRGIGTDQLKIVGHSASKPIASNRTTAGRQLNRRVEVFISR